MHILYEIERLSTCGGIEHILTDKANYMADVWGWDVTILVLLGDEARPFYTLSPKVRVEYLHIKSSGLLMCLQGLWRLNRAVRRLKPDVYVTVQTIGAMSCLLRTHSVPVIYEAHGIRTCMQHPLAMSMAERHADVVAVLTQNNARRYSGARRVELIPNFTTMTADRTPDYGRKHCVAVGRLDFEKDFSRMISIWEKVHRTHPDWVLDIYGDGPGKDALQQQTDRLGLTGNVLLRGRTDNAVEAYLSGSIYLLTSHFEGFPLVLIEASRCGLASVALNCPDGPRDIIEDGTTGYLVPYEDDDAMVRTIGQLMEDETKRRSMGLAARDASVRFSQKTVMEKWRNVFESL